MTKSAFTDNDIPHLNYDSIFANQISRNNIKRYIPNSFLISRTRRYLLNNDNILKGLDKLINNNSEIIIVAVNAGNRLEEILKNYNSIVKYIPSTQHLIQDVLFVLHRSDLPSIEHQDILEKEKAFNKLKLINKDLKIYSSIVDINNPGNDKIKEKWDSEELEDNAEVQVQVTIAFLAIIYWRKQRDIVQISIASKFREQGIQNDLSEIEPLKKVSKKEK